MTFRNSLRSTATRAAPFAAVAILGLAAYVGAGMSAPAPQKYQLSKDAAICESEGGYPLISCTSASTATVFQDGSSEMVISPNIIVQVTYKDVDGDRIPDSKYVKIAIPNPPVQSIAEIPLTQEEKSNYASTIESLL